MPENDVILILAGVGIGLFGGVVGSLSKNMGFLLPVYVWPVRCGTLNPTNRKQIPGVNSLLLGE